MELMPVVSTVKYLLMVDTFRNSLMSTLDHTMLSILSVTLVVSNREVGSQYLLSAVTVYIVNLYQYRQEGQALQFVLSKMVL